MTSIYLDPASVSAAGDALIGHAGRLADVTSRACALLANPPSNLAPTALSQVESMAATLPQRTLHASDIFAVTGAELRERAQMAIGNQVGQQSATTGEVRYATLEARAGWSLLSGGMRDAMLRRPGAVFAIVRDGLISRAQSIGGIAPTKRQRDPAHVPASWLAPGRSILALAAGGPGAGTSAAGGATEAPPTETPPTETTSPAEDEFGL